jgi:plasmid stabilization system protein ParE
VKVALTPDALADLKEIGRWIAQDNPPRARSFVKNLRDASFSLGRQSQRFPVALQSAGSPIRKRLYHGYLIFYRVEAEVVQVLRIVHGSRDWAALLKDGN